MDQIIRNLDQIQSSMDRAAAIANRLADVKSTQQFGQECTEVLLLAPHCRLPLNRFTQLYARHFRRPCRLSDYGFTRLADLFQAVPETVILVGGDQIQLAASAARDAAAARERYHPGLGLFGREVVALLKAQPGREIAMGEFREEVQYDYFGGLKRLILHVKNP